MEICIYPDNVCSWVESLGGEAGAIVKPKREMKVYLILHNCENMSLPPPPRGWKKGRCLSASAVPSLRKRGDDTCQKGRKAVIHSYKYP